METADFSMYTLTLGLANPYPSCLFGRCSTMALDVHCISLTMEFPYLIPPQDDPCSNSSSSMEGSTGSGSGRYSVNEGSDGGNDNSSIPNNRDSNSLCASCDRCRARKTRCDGKRPCSACKHKYMKKHKLTNCDNVDPARFECF